MRSLALIIAVVVTIAACGGSPTTAAPDAGVRAVLATPLTDVRTGERFTLGGFPGRVTFFIAMAVW